jgi:Protein of unknown function (DUF3592)
MGESGITLPFTIEGRFGVQWKALRSLLLTVFVVLGGRLIITPPPDLGAYLHSTEAFVSLCVIGFILAIFLLSAAPYKVIADASGITVTSRNAEFFYAWSDIQDYRLLKNGLNIEMRGQTKEQNKLNAIPAPTRLQAEQLELLFRERVTELSGSKDQSHHSFTPGMIARKLYVRQCKTMAFVLFFSLFGLYVLFLANIGLGDLDQLILSQRGIHTQGQVLHTFADGCNRTHCTNKIEYRFKSTLNEPETIGYDTVPQGTHSLEAGQSVDVIYDPQSPSRSRAVFGGDFRPPSLQAFMWLAGVTFVIFAGVSLILVAVAYGPLRKALDQLPQDVGPRDSGRLRAGA